MLILVTGYAGTLGSNLTRRLLNEGHEVIGLDSHVTSLGVDAPHLVELREQFGSSLTEVDGDICDEKAVQMAFDCRGYCKVDRVFNLACPASPPKYQVHSMLTLDTCTVGVKNVLYNAAVRNARVLHASTSEVYGDPDKKHHPQSETYWGNVNPYGPRGMYDNGKRAAEAYCYEFRKKHERDVRIVRIFNTYGPGMDPFDGRVVTNFIRAALDGEDLQLYGDGEQTRSFCYVDDLIEGLIRTMELDTSVDFGPMNIGNDKEFSVKELAQCVIDNVPTTSKIVFAPPAADDPMIRRPDLTKARALIGWDPKVDLNTGIQKTIPWIAATLGWMRGE